ncbi:Extended synaptotagmin-3 [Mactra antiquata]
MADEKQPTTTKRKAVTEDTLLVAVLKRYFKYASAAVAIWGFGYYNFSPAWILLGLVVVVWKEKHNKLQQKKIEISQQAARNEKEAILARVEDLPSWVFFPDVERAEWLNKMIAQMWPFIGDYVQGLLMTSIQKTVQDSASVMGSFKFVNIDLGDIPPRIGGVKVYTEKVKRDEIYMDLDIIYSSDCEIEVQLKGIKAGIKDLQLHGTVRTIFKPLLSQTPFFGGLSVFFLNNPAIDFNLTSLANALDLPGLNDMLQTIIQENIANIMVLPNRIVVEMAKGLEISRLRYPQPDGVLRIHVVEAKELVKADISVLGKGKSDPYAVVRVGAMKFKTPVINNSVTPQWNEVFETIIDERDGQFMDVEVRDEDPGSKDDKLGNVSIELSPVSEKGTVDHWLPLENVKSGKLHLKLVWLYLSKDPQTLQKQIQANKSDGKSRGTDLSSCILMVNVDSARELPRSKKMSEPSPYVVVNVGQKNEESKIVADSTEPRWEQGFRFLVNDPNFQTVDFKIMDSKTDKSLGELSYPLKNLLSAPDMEVDRFFPLKKAVANSELSVRLSLRVLTTERNQNWKEESENLMTKPIPDAKETDLDEATAKDSGKSSPAGQQQPSSPGAKAPSSGTVPAGTGPPPEPVQIIPSATSQLKESNPQVVQRKKPSPSVSSTDSNQGEYGCGKIQLTLRYSMQRGKLIVCIHKCVCLLACDKDNFSDPYVKAYLLPDKSSKKKTKVINNNLNPVFDETFEYEVTPQELAKSTLDITVKNDTSLFSSSQKELGVVQIDMSKMDTSRTSTEWYDLQPGEDHKQKKETDI